MIFIGLYCVFVVILAYWNFLLIAKGKKIYHGLNGLLHIIASILVSIFHTLSYGVALLLLVRVIFDTALNIFREKGVGYVPPAPKSIVDQAEKWLILKIAGIIHSHTKNTSVDETVWDVAIISRLSLLFISILLLFL